jgi:hypothetical protein
VSKLTLADEVEQLLRAQESAGIMIGDLIVREMGSNTEKVEDYIKNDLVVRLERRGLDIEYTRLRTFYRVALRNPPEQRNGVSFTTMEEAGDHPDRFEWYAKYGATLSKRQVRKLRGDRKLDTAAGSKNATKEEKVTEAVRLALDLDDMGLALKAITHLSQTMLLKLLEQFPTVATAYHAQAEKSSRNGGGRRGAEWDDIDRLIEELERFDITLKERYEALVGQLHPDLLGQTRLLEAIGRHRSTLDLFEDGLNNGLTFDQFLATLDN